MLSINTKAYQLVKRLCVAADEHAVSITKTKAGATLIDAGIQAQGGVAAGKLTTEICMGGLGHVEIAPRRFGHIELPTIFVYTDHPAVATLGSQFAGWQIKDDDFFAIGSGPARALALKPRDIYDQIQYRDKADVAVMVLETASEPPDDLITTLSNECAVAPEQLFIILTPTTSIAGSTQVSGRVVETGVHKLLKLGVDPRSILSAWGCAPIAPSHPKFAEAMGKTNDVILYAGVTSYSLKHDNDEKLKELVTQAPSSTSKHYGKPFKQIFKEANYDFYKIDPHLFAPAKLLVNNVATGSVFAAGEINVPVLQQSLGL